MMMLWITLTGMTAAIAALMLFPLWRKQTAAPSRVDYDIAVYRDQLAEIDRDTERQLLTANQADAARTEIHRRMLAAGAGTVEPKTSGTYGSRFVLACIIILILPLSAMLMYAWLGNPQLPGRPYAQRQHDPDFILTNEAEHLEALLAANPDAETYNRLAGVWFILRRYDKAATAYQKIIDINGGDANIWASLGEAEAFAQEGAVTPEAHRAFVTSLRLDAHNPRARFYLGLSEAQTGQLRRAVEIWRDLEKDSPADATWMPMLKKQIAEISKNGGFDPLSVPPAPPSPTDPDAAAVLSMPPAEQNAAIHKMVDRLAAKMKSNPDDIEGWQRLAKAYRVLGETDKAEDAENKAEKLKIKTPENAAPPQ